MPPGLTEPVSEQPGAAWKQHSNWEQHTNQTITHNSIIPKQCSETSHFPAPFRFLFTFPGVIRRPMPSGVQRNSQRMGKLRSLTLPHLRGSVCHGQLLSLHGRQKLLQSKGRRWFTINYYRKDSAFLSLEVPSPHAHLLGSQCPPPEERRLSMPETGEKERNCLFKSYTNLE